MSRPADFWIIYYPLISLNISGTLYFVKIYTRVKRSYFLQIQVLQSLINVFFIAEKAWAP